MKITREQLQELYAMQDKLNIAMFEYGRVPMIYEVEHALFDELGEMNHELKASWCWWKKTQEPVDPKKVLGEFADVLHFALTYDLMTGADRTPNSVEIDFAENPLTVMGFILDVMETTWSKTIAVFRLAASIGISTDDLIEAYKEKNKVNYIRMANGY